MQRPVNRAGRHSQRVGEIKKCYFSAHVPKRHRNKLDSANRFSRGEHHARVRPPFGNPSDGSAQAPFPCGVTDYGKELTPFFRLCQTGLPCPAKLRQLASNRRGTNEEIAKRRLLRPGNTATACSASCVS